MLSKIKYYTIQKGQLIEQSSANEAQYTYSKNMHSSLVEVLPNKTILLFNKTLEQPISCDTINYAFYLALSLTAKES